MGRITKRSAVPALRAKLGAEGKRVVFTNGCFDIIHRGHVELLRKASLLGDYLVVGLNSDSSVRRLKGGNRPIINEKDRAFILSSLEMVDCVTLFDEDTPAALIEEWQPDVLVKGGDYKPEDVVGRNFVEAKGGVVIIVPLVEGYSTSAIIAEAAETTDNKDMSKNSGMG